MGLQSEIFIIAVQLAGRGKKKEEEKDRSDTGLALPPVVVNHHFGFLFWGPAAPAGPRAELTHGE